MEDDERPPEILQEDADVEPQLKDIPEAETGSKRKDGTADEDEPLFVSSSDEEFFTTQRARQPKRRKRNGDKSSNAPEPVTTDDGEDDKKKLALNTSYDGFSIYGRILCLVVKRKGKKTQPGNSLGGGSQMMEQWVSTQAAQDAGLDEDDDG